MIVIISYKDTTTQLFRRNSRKRKTSPTTVIVLNNRFVVCVIETGFDRSVYVRCVIFTFSFRIERERGTENQIESSFLIVT
mmetsp:Transcript_17650/g.17820  ORF Transcript_17650/g.17820 Transcript_17650/m.17820 type:complete len:81 (+) Transcript_17650:38-280(+)